MTLLLRPGNYIIIVYMGVLTKRLLIIMGTAMLAVVCYYTFSGWLNIIPWAIAALIVGYVSISLKDIIINGALFGYLLFAVYIACGYRGKDDAKSLTAFIIFTLLFSIIGAVSGVAGAFLGNFVRKKTNRTYE